MRKPLNDGQLFCPGLGFDPGLDNFPPARASIDLPNCIRGIPMDEAIRKLKSTTFFGRCLTRRQIAAIQQAVHDCPGLSRNELGRALCEHLDWRTEKGEDRIQAVLRLLERLQEWGVLRLPEKQGRRREPNRRPA